MHFSSRPARPLALGGVPRSTPAGRYRPPGQLLPFLQCLEKGHALVGRPILLNWLLSMNNSIPKKLLYCAPANRESLRTVNCRRKPILPRERTFCSRSQVESKNRRSSVQLRIRRSRVATTPLAKRSRSVTPPL